MLREWVFGTALILAVWVGTGQATVHQIQFGSSFGLRYSPDNLDVTVGDTLRWTGSFASHPMSSTSVPNGAEEWTVSSGAIFNYTVEVPGQYDYQCDTHAASGMTGSFTAEAGSAVSHSAAPGWTASSFTQRGGGVLVRLSPELQGRVRIRLFSPEGRVLRDILRTVESEIREIEIAELPPGLCLFSVDAAGQSYRGKVLIPG